jgi:hypothetical protein
MAGEGEDIPSFGPELLDPTLLSSLAELCISMTRSAMSHEARQSSTPASRTEGARPDSVSASRPLVKCERRVSYELGSVDAEIRTLDIVEGLYISGKLPRTGVRTKYYFEWTEESVDLAYRDVDFIIDGIKDPEDLGNPLETYELEDAVDMSGVTDYDVRYLIAVVQKRR